MIWESFNKSFKGQTFVISYKNRPKRTGYNRNVMREIARSVNPITANFASLLDCTPVGRASDSVIVSCLVIRVEQVALVWFL